MCGKSLGLLFYSPAYLWIVVDREKRTSSPGKKQLSSITAVAVKYLPSLCSPKQSRSLSVSYSYKTTPNIKTEIDRIKDSFTSGQLLFALRERTVCRSG